MQFSYSCKNVPSFFSVGVLLSLASRLFSSFSHNFSFKYSFLGFQLLFVLLFLLLLLLLMLLLLSAKWHAVWIVIFLLIAIFQRLWFVVTDIHSFFQAFRTTLFHFPLLFLFIQLYSLCVFVFDRRVELVKKFQGI